MSEEGAYANVAFVEGNDWGLACVVCEISYGYFLIVEILDVAGEIYDFECEDGAFHVVDE